MRHRVISIFSFSEKPWFWEYGRFLRTAPHDWEVVDFCQSYNWKSIMTKDMWEDYFQSWHTWCEYAYPAVSTRLAAEIKSKQNRRFWVMSKTWSWNRSSLKMKPKPSRTVQKVHMLLTHRISQHCQPQPLTISPHFMTTSFAISSHLTSFHLRFLFILPACLG